MTRVASLYYLEDMIQSEIAKSLGLSRIKVGRLLKKARREGIVEIDIIAHPALSLPLEDEIKERLNLRQVLLAPEVQEPNHQRALVARAVAGFLSRNLGEGTVVGVSMGRNVGTVAQQASSVLHRSCTFASILGGSPQVGQLVNPNDICVRLAEAFGGKREGLYAPAYAESRAVRDAFLSHEDVLRTLNLGRNADFALVGIGDARNDSYVVQMGCFSAQEMKNLRQSGAVGDILGHFFDINGLLITHGMGGRVVGLSADDLRGIPCVIGIASETDKATAILGALRTGIVDILATSIGNARRILDLNTEYPRSSDMSDQDHSVSVPAQQ